MSDIFDYMDWRGDIPVCTDGVNEVDGLIFSQMSYIPFEMVCEDINGLTLEKIYEKISGRISEEDMENMSDLLKNSYAVLEKMASCDRYGKLKLVNYVADFNPDDAKQFAAVTVALDDGNYYVAYRGTDDTLVGWEEDFRACYMMPVLSQTEAVKYLDNVMSCFHGSVYAGGHSKGGNLAVYAAMEIRPEYRDRIIRVDNYDGPGFLPEFVEREEYRNMSRKIYTYNPECSIVGMIMFNGLDGIIVESNAKGFQQHSGITWMVKGKQFVRGCEYEKLSRNFAGVNKAWINEISAEERELAIEIVFRVLRNGFDTVTGMKEGFFNTAATIIRSYKDIDKSTRKAIGRIIGKMIRLGGGSISEIRREHKKISVHMDNEDKK